MEWNRRNIILVLVTLVLGFGSGSVMYVHQEGGLEFVMFRFEKWISSLYGRESEMTAEEERIAKRETERIRKEIIVNYPSLRLEGNEVVAEQNGFLALFELAKNPDIQKFRDGGILDQLSKDGIDPAAIRKELAAFDTLGKEIELIAALPERSNIIDGNIHSELLRAGEIKSMGEYLVLRARLAALDGNEAESFRYLSLAVNLSEHIGSIEAPYLLSETVYILMRLGVRSEFFKSILPALGKSTDLAKWQSILEPRTDVPQKQGLLLRGEWNVVALAHMYLVFEMVPDPEETLIAFAKYNDANSKRYDAMDFQQYSISKDLPYESFTKHLSREGEGIFDLISIHDNGWLRGSIRSVVEEHYYAAALDLLIREQKGEDISKLKETFLLNPQTAKPYAYDSATRTLEKITGAYSVDAFKLPW